MSDGLLQRRLSALFALALLLFNYPLIALWDHEASLLGLPLFPAALFTIWALLIAWLAWLLEHRAADASTTGDRASPESTPSPGP
jgi:hypothetical protein